MTDPTRLAFIGAGNMATALARGVLAAKLLKPVEVLAADPDAERRRLFESATGAHTTTDNAAAVRAEVVILALKPQIMPRVLAELGPALSAGQLVISIAAGISTATIESASPRPIRVVRAMPNTPMLVGAGAAALSRGKHATAADLARARELMASCARVIEVPEELLHAVTALSGSGPAYCFYFAEILAQAGVRMGLSEPDAVLLANQTLFGASKMLAETGEPAADLRRKVTSPGGTTEAALRSMEADDVAGRIIRALEAARRRSVELSGGAKKD